MGVIERVHRDKRWGTTTVERQGTQGRETGNQDRREIGNQDGAPHKDGEPHTGVTKREGGRIHQSALRGGPQGRETGNQDGREG